MQKPQMTSEEQRILFHALGLDRSKKPYRNHYCTEEGADSWRHVGELVAAGLMKQVVHSKRMHYFGVTEAGMRAIGVDPRKNVELTL
jgi:hypothetical protein